MPGRKPVKRVVMGTFAVLDRAYFRANPVQGPALPPHRASVQAQLAEALGPAPDDLVALVNKALR